ncbi:putative transmembrane protein [Toxoplasma gondii RUB]|uniref:Putative transmembrane protein n=1 Tax=Toxoplasma gondii RUB TaxID=935652 RepID=A0A086LMB9_TOXGO|nr:putative transmembrane protein [Toxoplasma gondii RUB]
MSVSRQSPRWRRREAVHPFFFFLRFVSSSPAALSLCLAALHFLRLPRAHVPLPRARDARCVEFCVSPEKSRCLPTSFLVNWTCRSRARCPRCLLNKVHRKKERLSIVSGSRSRVESFRVTEETCSSSQKVYSPVERTSSLLTLSSSEERSENDLHSELHRRTESLLRCPLHSSTLRGSKRKRDTPSGCQASPLHTQIRSFFTALEQENPYASRPLEPRTRDLFRVPVASAIVKKTNLLPVTAETSTFLL